MEVHHLVGEHIENVAKSRCLYCNTLFDITKWESYLLGEIHYKRITCSCGKTMTMHVNFDGDGHDNWHTRKVIAEEQQNLPGIDERIQQVEQENQLIQLEDEIREAIQKNEELPFSVLAGKIIQDMKGKAESSQILQIINKIKTEQSNK